MKYIKFDDVKNPFKCCLKDQEPRKNKQGLLFLEHSYGNLQKAGNCVMPVFESIDEFKGFVEYYRKDIIKKASPLKKDYYVLKMRKYDTCTLYYDFALNLFTSVEAANACREYLKKFISVYKEADLRICDKDDNEIDIENLSGDEKINE